MKILSGVVLTVGLLALLGGAGVLTWGCWTAYWHYATLSTGRSAEFVNPLPILIGGGAILAAGGFFAGLGLGMPKGPKAPASATPTTI